MRALRRTLVSGEEPAASYLEYTLILLGSNFQGTLLIDLLRYARIKPAVLQVELHPYLPQEQLVALCKAYDIAITAYCSFGPASWLELDMHKHVQGLLDHDLVSEIAKKHSKSEPPF